MATAAARAAASETPRIAFAPSLDLVGVPSSAISAWSSAACSDSDPSGRPTAARASSPLAFATARKTPLPPYRFASPSRSSSASREPVEAPEGTAALPIAPLEVRISTSTVGLPRESRISRARTPAIVSSATFPPGFAGTARA